jgi:large subunit ribosomal protein LP0
VFTRGDLVEVRDKLLENKVRAPARNGAIAPCPVIIPAQNTGLGPEKTSFFQALSIPTKISKGTIEIIVSKVPVTSVHLVMGWPRIGIRNMICYWNANSAIGWTIMRLCLACHFKHN